MNTVKKLPVGIENFEEIRTEGFYYIDKTGLIRELLDNWSKVTLFTRPRRFGKSLNMNMLKTFFQYGCDGRLFEGLEIGGEEELCQKYMGKFPVVSISLKDIDAGSYEGARAAFCSVIGYEALRFQYLAESERLSEEERERYKLLIQIGGAGQDGFLMSEDVLKTSIQTLCQLLQKHHGQKAILLIDEYDVPLDKAYHAGYYDKMILLIRNLFSWALKTNDSLYFSVLTGCLRIAKESVFTGLNNFSVMSVSNVAFAEYFGFSDGEVRAMLEYYGLGHKFDLIKEWYDGYRFGNTGVYCPWDVINYVKLLRFEPDALPRAFWRNTSGNAIIRHFLKMAKASTRRELERLIDGGWIEKKIDQELTYQDLYKSIDNPWSVLFVTGYLTQTEKPEGEIIKLTIPNLEIRQIFVDEIQEWFQEETRRDASKLDAFCEAFIKGDARAVETQFNAYLQKTISIRDTAVRRGKKENFYHGLLLGLLSHQEDWDVSSNAESGDGFSDILVEIEGERIGIVIEVKYPDEANLDAGCREALEQIERMNYADRLWQDGMETILKYGIACNKKRCRVEIGR